MKLECIEKAVGSGMILHTWDDKYDSGVWLLLAGSGEDANAIQTFSEKGDKENSWLKDFAHSKRDDITLVLADSLELGLEMIELRLNEMPISIYDKESSLRKSLSDIYHAIKSNA